MQFNILLTTVALTVACSSGAQVKRAEPPAVAPTAPSVEWRADEGVISCPALGAKIVMLSPATVVAASVSSSRVVVVGRDQQNRALCVTSERASDDLREAVLEDFGELNMAISGSAPDNITVRQLQLTDGRLVVEYTRAEDPEGDAFVLEYRLIERNGWTCRVGALEKIGHDSAPLTAQHVIDRFGRVEDTKGIDLTRPSGPSANAGGYRLLLDGLFVVGLNVFRAVGPP